MENKEKDHAADSGNKKILEEKKQMATKLAFKYATFAAANGVNPIPGANIAIDVAIFSDLFRRIRNIFDLSGDKIDSLPSVLAPLANNIVRQATREGAIILVRRFAKRQARRWVLRYIPVFGQALSATVAFAITYQAAQSYLNDCYNLAKEIEKIK